MVNPTTSVPTNRFLEGQGHCRIRSENNHRDLAASLYRSYSTALALIGNANQAEAIVIDAVEGLDAEHVTCKALRCDTGSGRTRSRLRVRAELTNVFEQPAFEITVSRLRR